MNSIFRTAGGKVLLFCLCVILAAAFLASSASAVIMLEEGLYEKSYEEIYGHRKDAVNLAHDILWTELLDGER